MAITIIIKIIITFRTIIYRDHFIQVISTIKFSPLLLGYDILINKWKNTTFPFTWIKLYIY